MTRTVFASILALVIACPAFAASDEQVRQLALSMQSSQVSAESFGAGDMMSSISNASPIAMMTGRDNFNSVTADSVNDLAISKLTVAPTIVAVGGGDVGPSDEIPWQGCGVAGCGGPPFGGLHPIDMVIDPCESGGGPSCGFGGFTPVDGDDQGDLGGFMPVEPETGGGLLAEEPPMSMDMPMDGGMYTDGGQVLIEVGPSP